MDIRVRVGDVDCSSGSVLALKELDDARRHARVAAEIQATLRRRAVLRLVADGGSYRAVAKLVGVSYQRVGQIVADARTGPNGKATS